MSEPIKTMAITMAEHELLWAGMYEVRTVVPYIPVPEAKVYHMNQDELDDFLEGYVEYAEYIIGVRPLFQWEDKGQGE